MGEVMKDDAVLPQQAAVIVTTVIPVGSGQAVENLEQCLRPTSEPRVETGVDVDPSRRDCQTATQIDSDFSMHSGLDRRQLTPHAGKTEKTDKLVNGATCENHVDQLDVSCVRPVRAASAHARTCCMRESTS